MEFKPHSIFFTSSEQSERPGASMLPVEILEMIAVYLGMNDCWNLSSCSKDFQKKLCSIKIIITKTHDQSIYDDQSLLIQAYRYPKFLVPWSKISNQFRKCQFQFNQNLLKKCFSDVVIRVDGWDELEYLITFIFNHMQFVGLFQIILNSLHPKDIEVETDTVKEIQLFQQTSDLPPKPLTKLEKKWHVFLLAIRRGYYDLVKLLLETTQINPGSNNNQAMIIASLNGYTKIADLLLKDSRVDPSARGNEAIRNAARNGDCRTVALLLKDPRVDPTMNEDECIRLCCLRGYLGTVKILLSDKRVDPSTKENECIRNATKVLSYKHNIEICKLLLEDERVNPSQNDNEAIKNAANFNSETYELLLKDERVKNGSLVIAKTRYAKRKVSRPK
jgi:hypothetical protein